MKRTKINKKRPGLEYSKLIVRLCDLHHCQFVRCKLYVSLSRGGGLVVSVIAFYWYDLSLNSPEVYFYVKCCLKYSGKKPGLVHILTQRLPQNIATKSFINWSQLFISLMPSVVLLLLLLLMVLRPDFFCRLLLVLAHLDLDLFLFGLVLILIRVSALSRNEGCLKWIKILMFIDYNKKSIYS